jgi:hypothetical protein
MAHADNRRPANQDYAYWPAIGDGILSEEKISPSI